MSNPHDQLLTDLHETQRRRLERLVATRVRDAELAADLVSEAFLRLHGTLRADRVPDRPVAWLTRVALNLAISETRHRRVADDAAPRLAWGTTPPGPAQEVLDRDELRRVVLALGELPKPDRDLVVQAAAGASGQDLGARHGVSGGCARVRLCRARHRLRHAIDDG